MFDAALRSARTARARAMDARAPGRFAALMEWAADDMAERLALVERRFAVGIAAFGRTPYLAGAMAGTGRVETVRRLEEAGLHAGDAERVVASIDAAAPTAESCDLVCAPLSLHHARDLPAALARFGACLRPDGLLLASLPGPASFAELREALLAAEAELVGGAARRVDPFTDLQSAGSLLQAAGLALPVTDRDRVTLRYPSLEALVADLRGMAATRQTGEPLPALTRTVWERTRAIYEERFTDPDGRLRATFEAISMQAWKPHASQQKPLARGSGRVSMSDALGRS